MVYLWYTYDLEVYHTQHTFKYIVVFEIVYVVLDVYHTLHTFKYMLCWRFTIDNRLSNTFKYMLCWRFIIDNIPSNICCVGGIKCCVGGMPYTNTLSDICCVVGIRCCVGGLPYTTHIQTYVVLEVKHVVLEVYHTHALSNDVVCKSLLDHRHVCCIYTYIYKYIKLNYSHGFCRFFIRTGSNNEQIWLPRSYKSDFDHYLNLLHFDIITHLAKLSYPIIVDFL